jgi:hypothetical protein
MMLAIALAACIGMPYAVAAELSKADAIKILEAKGYTNVVVAVIINGSVWEVNYGDWKYLGPGVATLNAIGKKDGKETAIMENLFYDKELGWFSYKTEYEQGDDFVTHWKVRLWTTTGYRELSVAPKQ